MNARPPLARPTRRDESWRYSDFDALGEVWPTGVISESLLVPAGNMCARVMTSDSQPVSVRDLSVTLAAGSRLDLRVLLDGQRYGRLAIDVTLHGGAHFELGAAILGTAAQTLEIVTTVRHAEPGATSNQVIRSVLGGKATGTCLGKVIVAPGAQKTDAAQSVKAMLLDRTATANLKPELEIFADDVKCAHGATVGELDATQYFYMTSRGLAPPQARALLLQAFIADAFVGMADADERERIEMQARTALEAMT